MLLLRGLRRYSICQIRHICAHLSRKALLENLEMILPTIFHMVSVMAGKYRMDHRTYNFQTARNAHSTIIKEGYILTNQVSVWEEKSDLSLTGPAFLGAKTCWWSLNLLRASCVSCAAYDSCMALGLITTTTCLAQAFPVRDDPHGRKMAPFWLSERNHYHTGNMKQHEWDIVGWHVE